MCVWQTERKPVTVPSSTESKVLAIAKDWLAGGTAAGVSKTIVAPIGENLSCARLQSTPGVLFQCPSQRRKLSGYSLANMFGL